MNQIATQETFTTIATAADIAAAMTGLSVLPSRAMASPDVEKLAYLKALEGVTKHGLEKAVENILRGSLGHGFMPSPPELRQECDAVMRPILEARARESQERKIREAMAADRKRAEWTPESKARATAKWQEIKARMAADDAARKATDGMYDTSPQASLARLSAYAAENGAELDLDKIPSLSGGSFTQIGRAA